MGHNSRKKMKAVILAAGISSRLYPLTRTTPKCLLAIGGKALIGHQIESLTRCGVKNIAVVVGFRQKKVINYLLKNYPDLNFSFIFNPLFASSNTIYSLWLTRGFFTGNDFLFFNGDVLCSFAVVKKLAAYSGSVLAVKKGPADLEAVRVAGKRFISDIGKDIPMRESVGEFIGVAKFSPDFTPIFIKHLSQRVKINKQEYFESALWQAIRKDDVRLLLLDIKSEPAIEIDFDKDLSAAKLLYKANKISWA